MLEAIKIAFDYLISKGYSLYLVVIILFMATIIFLILNVIKKPIKALTKKITNEIIRKLINKSIILLAFGLSAGIWFLLNWLIPDYFGISESDILLSGALPVVAYAMGDGLKSTNTKTLLNEIMEATKDGKVTDEEAEKLIEKVKESKNAQKQIKSDAENALDNLLNE